MAFDPTGIMSEDLKQKITDGILERLARLTKRAPAASKTLSALKSDASLQEDIDYSGPRCQDSRSRKIRKLFQHQTKPSMRAMDFVYPVRWSVAVVVGGGGSVVNSAVGSCPQFPRPAPPS